VTTRSRALYQNLSGGESVLSFGETEEVDMRLKRSSRFRGRSHWTEHKRRIWGMWVTEQFRLPLK